MTFKITPKFALELYVLFIFLFANAYFWTEGALPENEESIYHALYLSVVTITTLGYGDIAPANSWGMGYAAFEAVLGIVTIGLFLSSLWQKFTDHIENSQRINIENLIRDQNLRKLDGLTKYIVEVSTSFNQLTHEMSTSPREREEEDPERAINIKTDFEINRLIDIFEPSCIERFSREPVFILYYQALDVLCEEFKLVLLNIDFVENQDVYDQILEFLTISKNNDVRKSLLSISQDSNLKQMAIEVISRNRSLFKSIGKDSGVNVNTFDLHNPYCDSDRDDFDVAMTIDALHQSIKAQMSILNPVLTKMITLYPIHRASQC